MPSVRTVWLSFPPLRFCMILYDFVIFGGDDWRKEMIRICRIKLTFHDVPGLIGTMLTGIRPPAAGATGAESAHVELEIRTNNTNNYTHPSRKISEATWNVPECKELMGCSLSTNGLCFLFVCFCIWHVCSFSVLFSGMRCRWVSFCTSFARQEFAIFLQVSSAFRCWHCIHFFMSLMLLTPRQDSILDEEVDE